MDSATPTLAQYVRIGTVVIVSGMVTVDATAGANTVTTFELTLPIASDLGAAQDAAGAGAINDTVQLAVQVFGSAANNRAVFRYTASGTGSLVMTYSYLYRII